MCTPSHRKGVSFSAASVQTKAPRERLLIALMN